MVCLRMRLLLLGIWTHMGIKAGKHQMGVKVGKQPLTPRDAHTDCLEVGLADAAVFLTGLCHPEWWA